MKTAFCCKKTKKNQTTVKIAALDSTMFSHPEPSPVPLSLSPADCSHLSLDGSGLFLQTTFSYAPLYAFL